MQWQSKIDKLERKAERLPVVSEAALDAEIAQAIAEIRTALAAGATEADIVAFYCDGTTGENGAIIADIARALFRLAGG